MLRRFIGPHGGCLSRGPRSLLEMMTAERLGMDVVAPYTGCRVRMKAASGESWRKRSFIRNPFQG